MLHYTDNLTMAQYACCLHTPHPPAHPPIPCLLSFHFADALLYLVMLDCTSHAVCVSPISIASCMVNLAVLGT